MSFPRIQQDHKSSPRTLGRLTRGAIAGAAALALVVGVVGCESSRKSTAGALGPHGVFAVAGLHDVQTTPYRIDPPDEVTIHAPKIKEIDGLKETVRPDGTISLNLLGNIKVAGLTVDEVTNKLKEAAKVYYMEPDIKIQVVANSKFYYVYGQTVNAPGKKAYTGHDTVISALAEAGFNEASWPQQVLLARPATKDHPKPEVAVIDFTKIYDWGETDQNYIINEGDIIHVRPGPLWKINQDLNKFVGPLTGAGVVAGTAAAATPGAAAVNP